MTRKYLFISVLVPAFIQGCRQPTEYSDPVTEILQVTVDRNSNNVVSALVRICGSNLTSAAVEYGTNSAQLRSTPFFPMTSDSATVPVLGLLAGTTYSVREVAFSSSGAMASSTLQPFTTDSLPGNLLRFTTLHNINPSSGYVMLGITSSSPGQSYAIIVDNDANTVLYRAFDGAVVDFQKQPNGFFSAYSTLGGALPGFHEFDGAGNITREYRATTVAETGPHELRIHEAGFCLFGVEFREMDLTKFGGFPNARVRGIIVEHHRTSGVFVWNTFDHLQVSDAAPDIPLTTQNVNPWHGNAIEIDSDGNLLLLFRNTEEVTKINAQTGEIIWRLGGRRNEFTFINNPLNRFSHQHGIRRLQNGNIILFDNGNLHAPQISRAVEYALDEQARTATLVWEYRPDPPLYGFALGFAQRLSNGNTLICFGTAQRVIEVDRLGIKQWEISIDDPSKFAYRAIRIDSLY